VLSVEDLLPGLAVSYYEVPPGTLKVPAYRTMVPYRTGSVSQVNFPSAGADTNFAGSGRADYVGAVFDGFIKMPTAGSWKLSLESDDGGMLYVNDALVVDNDGIHATIEVTGTVTLSAGRHPIRIEWFEGDGGAVLVLRAEGPGFAKAVVPSSMLSRRIGQPVATVAVTPATATLAVGGTQQLAATPKDAAGTELTGRTVTWTSSDSAVATVSSAGLITAAAYIGAETRTATITATSEGKSASVAVTVTPRPVATVQVTPATVTLGVGATQQLTAVSKDLSGAVLSGRSVTWTTSNAAVATVSDAGLATAVAAGTATITATATDRQTAVPAPIRLRRRSARERTSSTSRWRLASFVAVAVDAL
jgi:hypothetical protein